MTAVLEVQDLHRRYGDTVALDGVDLTVDAGVLGIVGRNGAGKTTLVETVAGLRLPDRGSVRVLGMDPRRDRARVRQALGVQLQQSLLHTELTVRELVRMFRSFYADGHDPDELIERLGLDDVRRTRFSALSGGQQQRLSVAVALVGRPGVVILDELTTGLDPEGRRDIWGLVERIRAEGTAIVLVSHAMEEVERLCDRVVVLDRGRIIGDGTPQALVASSGGTSLEDAFLMLTSGAGAEDGGEA